MRISDLIDARSVKLDASPKSKSEALDMAVELMNLSGKLNNPEAYRKQVYAREEESTTGIGEGIAIPHGKCDAVNNPGLAAMVIKDGVDFDSLDGEPVTLLFLIAAPNTEDNVHLDVLSKLSVLLMDEEFTEKLRNAASVEEFLGIIDGADEETKSIDEKLHCLAMAAGIADRETPAKQAATDFIQAVKDMKKRFGIGDKIKEIRKEDIPKLARYADKEANPLYPVPVLMDAKELEFFYNKLLEE